jgi:hypothetical protein
MHVNARALFGVSLWVALGCSDSPKKAGFADNDCTGTACGVSGPTGGGATGGAPGAGGAEGTVDSGTSTTSSCVTDPGSGLTLCANSAQCPNQIFDATTTSGLGATTCGYVPGQNYTVQCICGNLVCPLAVNPPTQCTYIQSQIANSQPCNQVGTTACTDVTTISGSGGASTCDSTCRAACMGSLPCVTACGC